MALTVDPLLMALAVLLLALLVVCAILIRQRAMLEASQRSIAAEREAADARECALSERLEALQLEHEEQRRTLEQFRIEAAAEAARHRAEMHSADDKLQMLQAAREQMSAEFGQLASKIFNENAERFAKQSGESLGLTLTPLREQLSEFRKRVDQVHSDDTETRARLLHEITSLKDLNRKMSDEAVNLTKALKGDNKIQGGWGEVILQRVLEDSGLRQGHEYETQVALRHESGQRRMPDVIVRLPEGRDVVIDSKVSLVDYERYCSAEQDADREQALKAHVASLKAHIEALHVKDYEGLEGIRSLDFVLVFVPIEAAFMRAVEADPSLFSRAYDRNVIVVSPTTLLATLRTVQTIWRYERQNRNAEEIARQAGGLHDQFVLVIESLEDMGKQLARARETYELTLDRFSRGRGNLVNRVARLEKLGAKARKQMPAAVMNRSDEDPDDDPESLPPA